MKKLLLVLLLSACTVQETPPAPVPPAPIEEAPAPKPVPIVLYRAGWNNIEWSRMVAKALDELGQDLMKAKPADLTSYCPAAGDRKQCFIGILSSLAKYESGYKPASSYQESFKDSKGNYVISRGLLQISQESANGYGCGITKAEQLHDPETNLRCGVRIMNRWIVRDGAVAGGKTSAWKGMARYWSPFRDAAKVKAMQEATKKMFN